MKKNYHTFLFILGLLVLNVTFAVADQCLTYRGYRAINAFDEKGRVTHYNCTLKYKPLEFGMDYYCEDNNCTEEKLNKAIRVREKDLRELERCKEGVTNQSCSNYVDVARSLYLTGELEKIKKSLQHDITALKRKRRDVQKESAGLKAASIIHPTDDKFDENKVDDELMRIICNDGSTSIITVKDELLIINDLIQSSESVF